MAKRELKPGNLLYPVPAVMVTVSDGEGHDNIITLAWAGTVNSDPPMVSVSVRKSRHSHGMLMKSREFAVNLVTEDLVSACDLCGVVSGRDADKFEKAGLHREKAAVIGAPLIAESPVNLECRVKSVTELGSHDLFLAEIVNVRADESLFTENGKLDLGKARLIAYSHGEYRALGKLLGTFGFSVRKRRKPSAAPGGPRKKKAVRRGNG